MNGPMPTPVPTLPLATAGDREVLVGSVSLSAPRQAAEAVEPALVATLADTAKTSKLAVAITRYGGGRRLGELPPRRLTSSLVEYTITVRMASAPDVLKVLEMVPQGELTTTLKRKITELNLEDDFQTNGGGMNSLTLKQRSINRAPSAGDGPAPPEFGGNISGGTDAPAEEDGGTDFTFGYVSPFYLSGAGVVLLCMVAMYFTQSKEKSTPVVDISELEEAKPEAKPPKKKKRKSEGWMEGADLADAEEKPETKAGGKVRRSRYEGGRRSAEEMSDIAAASTTASSDSGQRYSDASSALTLPSSMPPNRPLVRGEAPGQLPRRGKTEGSRGGAGPGVQRRYTTDVDARRVGDARALRSSATGTYQPHLDGRAPRQSERAGRQRP